MEKFGRQTPETHTYPPLQGDPSHRIGIFTKITEGGDEIDLAIFRENQINVPLQAIEFKSIISINDSKVPEHQELIATPISLREDDTLYHTNQNVLHYKTKYRQRSG